jgi:cytochrome c553
MKRWLERIGITLLAVVALCVIAFAAIWVMTSRCIHRKRLIAVEHVAVPTDSASIARGRHLANVVAHCTECHGANFQGQVLIDQPLTVVLASANLTSGKGGVAGDYHSDDDWVRSIRHGIRPDGRKLILMPAQQFYYLDDADLGDIIAYLKTLPPQDNVVPAPRVGPMGRILLALRRVRPFAAERIDHTGPRPPAVAPGVTPAYGAYLVRIFGCPGCHRANFAGGPIAQAPNSPPAANLTPAGDLGSWTEAQFMTALRTGRRPDRHELVGMPWPTTAHMTDAEIGALWAYLKTVPAVASGAPRTGGRRRQ